MNLLELATDLKEKLEELGILREKVREYNLFIKANELSTCPLRLRKCNAANCTAMCVTDEKEIIVYENCREIFSCELQSEKCDNIVYCERHENKFWSLGNCSACCPSCYEQVPETDSPDMTPLRIFN